MPLNVPQPLANYRIKYGMNLKLKMKNSVISDLASDLNFYEPLERDRDEALGYFGDEKLLALTSETLKKIDKQLTSK
jgi:hypothetical protein